jgi:hypothetical protein
MASPHGPSPNTVRPRRWEVKCGGRQRSLLSLASLRSGSRHRRNPRRVPTHEARPGMMAAEFYTPVPRVLQSRHRGKIRAEGGEIRSRRADSSEKTTWWRAGPTVQWAVVQAREGPNHCQKGPHASDSARKKGGSWAARLEFGSGPKWGVEAQLGVLFISFFLFLLSLFLSLLIFLISNPHLNFKLEVNLYLD